MVVEGVGGHAKDPTDGGTLHVKRGEEERGVEAVGADFFKIAVEAGAQPDEVSPFFAEKAADTEVDREFLYRPRQRGIVGRLVRSMRVSNPGIERSAFGDGYAAGGAEFKAAHADAVNLGGSAFEITSARVRVAAGKRIDQSRTESEAGRLSKTDGGEAGGPKGEEGGAEVDVEKRSIPSRFLDVVSRKLKRQIIIGI